MARRDSSASTRARISTMRRAAWTSQQPKCISTALAGRATNGTTGEAYLHPPLPLPSPPPHSPFLAIPPPFAYHLHRLSALKRSVGDVLRQQVLLTRALASCGAWVGPTMIPARVIAGQ